MILKMLKRNSERKYYRILEKERKRAIVKAKETRVEWLVVLNTRLRPQAFSKPELKKMARKMNKSFTKIRHNALYITPKTIY